MDNDWKKRLGMVYSTNADFQYESGDQEETETLSPQQQVLYVSLDKKNRKGKKVTLVEGFKGTIDDLKSLAKELKSSCGVGGSVGVKQILIQGDFRDRVITLLLDKGFTVKRKGGYKLLLADCNASKRSIGPLCLWSGGGDGSSGGYLILQNRRG